MRHPVRTPVMCRTARVAGALAAAALLAVACTGGDDASTPAPRSGPLAGVCPDVVIVQTDWEPEAEHGGLYALVGDGAQVNAGARSVRGPLIDPAPDGPVDTGVDLEVRSGGSAIGYVPVESLLYSDPSVLLGMVRLSEAVTSWDATPTTAVLAMFDTSPLAVYWDPETHPGVDSVADLAAAGVPLFTGRPSPFVDWLVATGVVNPDLVDLSDAPKPATFVAAGGAVAEVGFVTAEPYLYEFEVPQWGRPVRSELVADLGFPDYFQNLAVRTADITGEQACLEALVPVLQRGLAAYLADPDATNDLIVSLVEDYATGWVYTAGAADYASREMAARNLVAAPGDTLLGGFDPLRVTELIDVVTDVSGVAAPPPSAGDLATNAFLDPGVRAPDP